MNCAPWHQNYKQTFDLALLMLKDYMYLVHSKDISQGCLMIPLLP